MKGETAKERLKDSWDAEYYFRIRIYIKDLEEVRHFNCLSSTIFVWVGWGEGLNGKANIK